MPTDEWWEDNGYPCDADCGVLLTPADVDWGEFIAVDDIDIMLHFCSAKCRDAYKGEP